MLGDRKMKRTKKQKFISFVCILMVVLMILGTIIGIAV